MQNYLVLNPNYYGPAIIEEYLRKTKSHSSFGRLVSTFNLRWFILDLKRLVLLYKYEKGESQAGLSEIPLYSIDRIYVDAQLPMVDKSKWRHGFVLVTKKRTFKLIADSRELMERFLFGFSNIVNSQTNQPLFHWNAYTPIPDNTPQQTSQHQPPPYPNNYIPATNNHIISPQQGSQHQSQLQSPLLPTMSTSPGLAPNQQGGESPGPSPTIQQHPGPIRRNSFAGRIQGKVDAPERPPNEERRNMYEVPNSGVHNRQSRPEDRSTHIPANIEHMIKDSQVDGLRGRDSNFMSQIPQSNSIVRSGVPTTDESWRHPTSIKDIYPNQNNNMNHNNHQESHDNGIGNSRGRTEVIKSKVEVVSLDHPEGVNNSDNQGTYVGLQARRANSARRNTPTRVRGEDSERGSVTKQTSPGDSPVKGNTDRERKPSTPSAWIVTESIREKKEASVERKSIVDDVSLPGTRRKSITNNFWDNKQDDERQNNFVKKQDSFTRTEQNRSRITEAPMVELGGGISMSFPKLEDNFEKRDLPASYVNMMQEAKKCSPTIQNIHGYNNSQPQSVISHTNNTKTNIKDYDNDWDKEMFGDEDDDKSRATGKTDHNRQTYYTQHTEGRRTMNDYQGGRESQMNKSKNLMYKQSEMMTSKNELYHDWDDDI